MNKQLTLGSLFDGSGGFPLTQYNVIVNKTHNLYLYFCVVYMSKNT